MATTLSPAFSLHDPTLLRQQCYVDGAWIDADDKKTIAVHNPADGQLIGTVPSVGVAETRRAIDAASAAWPAWRARTARERSAILRKWYDLMMANQEDLAVLMTVEQGKPLAESRGEIAYGAAFIEWFAEEGKRIYGDTIPAAQGDRRIVVIKQPIGVCAAVTPWNFPTAMITRKAGPALAAGCTMVIKPASYTPFSALALCALAERAGIPKGVLNVVTGASGPIGRELTDQPGRPQVHFHRFDRGRQAAHGAVRQHGEEGLARARRQCAVHRVRRCRPRRGGRGRDGLEVPQHGPDLRLRQPAARAGRRLRRIRAEARRPRRGAERRQRSRGRRHAGTADRHEGGGEGRGAHRRRGRQGGAGRDRRPAPCAGRHLLRADGAGRRRHHHGRDPRRDVRPGGAAVPLRDRAGTGRARQRYRVRPGARTSTAATSGGSGGSPRPSSTASSASTSGSFPRRSPRSAGSRSRVSAARAPSTGSRTSSRSSISAWAASTGNSSGASSRRRARLLRRYCSSP